MGRWKWFQRQDEPVDVVERPAYGHQGGAYGDHAECVVTGAERRQPEPPFAVILAGYVIDLHHRAVCPRCRPDGGCERLVRAVATLRAWRDRKRG
ncbi:hypothetical protein O7602_17895 [Micromonospora sp. WMMD1128]|uniref:hypothetical protein n=1 Tax=Micromonospora sp. WMMD1128 TaxID=3015150 RepID=UPI00248B9261|nr:hypothetical protein [Micromonospora sp. WMMD1128]WBB71613.1 hypothetical protein O7602_17895 [Micromonospora sp. WMMD1128]